MSLYRPTNSLLNKKSTAPTAPTAPTANMSTLFGGGAAAANPTQGELKNDVAVSQPPEDSISDLKFSPQAEYLAAASWDKKVRIWEVDGSGQTQARAAFDHEGPVLSCCWSPVSDMQ